jgi:hypothetical protein
MTRLTPLLLGIALLTASDSLRAQSPLQSSEEFARYAMKLREAALTAIEPRVSIPTTARTSSGVYRWRSDIRTTIFWCGENASVNNPVHNHSSSWDLNWAINFGGYDNPDASARTRDFRPQGFIPRLNPFYFALPYNDVTHGATKPEARQVIPWFTQYFVKEGQSVCKDRWIAIRNRRNGRIAYAQWSDCGPFRTDHWQYVFGDARPLPNLNGGAGLDVSPSVRDFLGLAPIDTTDWRFVELRDIPPGPWRTYGENNPFVLNARAQSNPMVNASSPSPSPRTAVATEELPKVIVR